MVPCARTRVQIQIQTTGLQPTNPAKQNVGSSLFCKSSTQSWRTNNFGPRAGARRIWVSSMSSPLWGGWAKNGNKSPLSQNGKWVCVRFWRLPLLRLFKGNHTENHCYFVGLLKNDNSKWSQSVWRKEILCGGGFLLFLFVWGEGGLLGAGGRPGGKESLLGNGWTNESFWAWVKSQTSFLRSEA